MPPALSAQVLHTDFVRCGNAAFRGHAYDASDAGRRYSIEILLDGVPIHVVRADLPDRTLLEAGYGDGCYAFALTLPIEKLAGHHVVEARLANRGTPVGSAISLSEPGAAASAFGPGRTRWIGGLQIEGEVELRDGDGAIGDYTIEARVGGKIVAAGKPRGWSFLRDDTGQSRPVATFALRLPQELADGQVHRVQIATQLGQDLRGSPLSIVAFDDMLHASVAKAAGSETELLRMRLLDHLMPASVPFTDYDSWRSRFPAPPCPAHRKVRIAVVAIGNGDTAALAAGLKTQTHRNAIAAVLSADARPAAFDPRALRDALAKAAGDAEFVVFTLAGAVLADEALARFADAFASFPSAAIAYADFALVSTDGRSWPVCLPAFDYERMLEQGYGACLFAVRRNILLDALDRGAADLYRLFNAAFDHPSPATGARAVHLPYPLATIPQDTLPGDPELLAAATRAHLEARRISATVEPHPGTLFPAVRARRSIAGSAGKVSIVTVTRNHAHALRTCLDSILAAETDWIEEIIVVDNETSDPADLAYLRSIDGSKTTVLRVPGPFDPSSLTNRAVAAARGRHVCLLDSDLQVVTRDWLAEMLSRIEDSAVGAVGPLVAWPNGVIRHAGMVLGAQFSAGHAFSDRMAGDPGYGDLLKAAHECSAVAATCLLARRSDYLAAGGLDETAFPATFADVDFCLRLQSRGMRTVFTPHARLARQPSAARRTDGRVGDERFGRALHALRERWGEALMDDPCYSPLLALDPIPYAGLAWPPRPCVARVNETPRPRGPGAAS